MADFSVILVALKYTDGSEETVEVGPPAFVRVERRWKGRQIPPIESTMFGAWFALGCPGAGDDDDAKFEGWMDTVAGIHDVEPEKVDPTLPAL